jgi:hypothetical protein
MSMAWFIIKTQGSIKKQMKLLANYSYKKSNLVPVNKN